MGQLVTVTYIPPIVLPIQQVGQLENTETRERKREREWEWKRKWKQPKDVENMSQSRGHTLAKSLR